MAQEGGAQGDIELVTDEHRPTTSSESVALARDVRVSADCIGAMHGVDITETDDQRQRNSLLRCLHSQRGVLLTLLSTVFFAMQGVVVSYLKDDLNSTEILAIRFFLIFSIVLPIVIQLGVPIIGGKGDMKFLLLRAFIGSINLGLKYFAYQNMRVGDATAIFFATPAFTGIFGRIFLKEPFQKLEMMVVVLTVAGVLIVSQPPFLFPQEEGNVPNTAAGIASAVAAMLMTSVLYVTMRAMGKRNIRPLQTMMYFALFGFIFLSIFQSASRGWVVPPCGTVRYILLGLGAVSFCGQLLITYVLTIEKAVVVSVSRSNEVVMAFLLEFLILGVAPSLLSCLGAILIVSSIMMLPLKKIVQERRNPVSVNAVEDDVKT